MHAIRPAAMDLWLVRHGEAVPESEDVSRPLSVAGIRTIEAVADALTKKTSSFDLVAASGKRRARQTAEILAAAAAYPPDAVEETDALSPVAPPEAFLDFLDGNRDKARLLAVGHLPSIAAIASFLLSPGGPVRLVFEPGTVCRIRLEDLARGSGELLYFQ